jgi:HSP20 family molecular chaperone IbpA
MNTQTLGRTPEQNGGRAVEKTRVRELTPAVDVYESESELMLVADLPGATHESLDLKIDLPELRIESKAIAGNAVWRRTFTIDERIDAEKVNAELKNGVLTVRLPKAAEVRPRRIAIRAGA